MGWRILNGLSQSPQATIGTKCRKLCGRASSISPAQSCRSSAGWMTSELVPPRLPFLTAVKNGNLGGTSSLVIHPADDRHDCAGEIDDARPHSFRHFVPIVACGLWLNPFNMRHPIVKPHVNKAFAVPPAVTLASVTAGGTANALLT